MGCDFFSKRNQQICKETIGPNMDMQKKIKQISCPCNFVQYMQYIYIILIYYIFTFIICLIKLRKSDASFYTQELRRIKQFMGKTPHPLLTLKHDFFSMPSPSVQTLYPAVEAFGTSPAAFKGIINIILCHYDAWTVWGDKSSQYHI